MFVIKHDKYKTYFKDKSKSLVLFGDHVKEAKLFTTEQEATQCCKTLTHLVKHAEKLRVVEMK